jgi:GNAT superfamily N-acetyltransferase
LTAPISQPFTIREMLAPDVAKCIHLRTQTREQRWTLEELARIGVTEDAVSRILATTHQGWVCEQDAKIVGFSMADGSTGEFWVVAVLPDYEGRGIGRQLIERGQQWLHDHGWPEIWLWTSPDTSTRAYQLYRLLGWHDCGVQNGQRIMRRRNEPHF